MGPERGSHYGLAAWTFGISRGNNYIIALVTQSEQWVTSVLIERRSMDGGAGRRPQSPVQAHICPLTSAASAAF